MFVEHRDPALARTTLGAPASAGGADARLEDVGLRGMITVKSDLADPTLAEALRQTVGLDAPAVRKAAFGDAGAALWMAPDELMLFCAYADAPRLAGTLDAAMKVAPTPTPHLVEVVSDARQVMRLVGSGARETLAKGAPIELQAGAFGLGDVRRTRIATVAAGIVQTAAEPDAFEVFCFRSYAPYLWRWLGDAAAAARPGVL